MPIDITNKEEKQIALTGVEIESALLKANDIQSSASEIDNIVTNGVTQSDLDALALSTGNLTPEQAETINSLDNFMLDLDDKPTYIDIIGNAWSDGKWKVTSSPFVTRIYKISDLEQYDILLYGYAISFQQGFSSLEITAQPLNNADINLITYNGTIFNNLATNKDVVTINGYPIIRTTISNFTPPTGAKSFIVTVKSGSTVWDGVQIFKRKGAKGILSKNPNANKTIAVCGDSVSQNPETEFGKERIRNLLGCKLHTYGVGGAGWSITATPSWLTANNVSGVYQIEELVKASSPTYDIYCLSTTLNDPITYQKAVGLITNCYPYLKTGGLPDFTDPNLDTMLGALNFCIQRIYEKNPKAKIIIGTMNKCFLTTSKNGYSTAAGYNPLDTSVNIKGSTYYDYVKAVRSLGDFWGVPIVDIYGKSGINQLNKISKMTDEYHPKVEGYSSIWNLWFDAIKNC